MKSPNCKKSVYIKMRFYNIIIILITVLAVSSILYYVFVKNLNEEIKLMNHKLLLQAAKKIDENVFNKAIRLSIDIVLQEHEGNRDLLYFFNNDRAMNNKGIANTYNYLNSIVTFNTDLVSSVFVYYKNNNMIISSETGVNFMNINPDRIEKEIYSLVEKEDLKNNILWIKHEDTDQEQSGIFNSDFITLIKFYPGISGSSNNKGFVGINVKASAMNAAIKEALPEELGEALLMNDGGKEGNNPHYQKVSGLLRSIEGDESIVDIDGEKSVVSVIQLKYAGIKLINIIPAGRFYRKSGIIQTKMVTICLTAIVIGFFISIVFTKKIYAPLGTTIKRLNFLSINMENSDETEKNEYTVINNAITNLYNTVSDLKSVIIANTPIMKHNFIIKIIKNKIRDEQELAQNMKMFSIEPLGPFYGLLLVMFPAEFSKIDIESEHYLKYTLMNKLEEMSDNVCLIITAELIDSKVVVIVNSNSGSDKLLKMLGEYIANYNYGVFTARATVCVGEMTSNYELISTHYNEMLKSFCYTYILPQQRCFYLKDIRSREINSAIIPLKYLKEYEHLIKAGEIESVVKILNEIEKIIIEESYSINQCKTFFLNTIYVLIQYIKDLRFTQSDVFLENLFEEYEGLTNIYEYKMWIKNKLQKLYYYIDEKKESKASEVIGKVIAYIESNIDEDLSLTKLADIVFLNPYYFSKLFKDETGINLSDFIIKKRMDKAINLMRDTKLSIKDITIKSGFNSPNYFNNRFKEQFGMTPGDYRRSYCVIDI